MGRNGVTINKLNGGLGRKAASDDGVCLLVIGSAVAATSLALKTAKELLSLADAEALGITPSYDDTNSILAHHHVDEFFRVNPNGNLFVILDDGSLTDAELKTALKANPTITNLGVVRNDAVAPVDMQVLASKYQTIVDDLRLESRDISSVLIEGGVFDNATLLSAYPDTRTYNSPNVSIVIGQDPIIRNLKAAYTNYAAIGTALGGISVRKVNENLGSLDIERKPNTARGLTVYSLTDAVRKRFVTAFLQDGKDAGTLTQTEYQTLDDRGYIYITNYNGYAGYFFSDSHTCVERSSDYSRIENNRVWDKAASLARIALLPRVKSNLLKDPETGFIREIEAKELEVLAENALDVMVSSEEISGKSIYINPEQNLSDGTPLNVKGQVVFNDIIHEMSFDLGLTSKLQ